MNADVLTRERVLDAAEEVLRRYGPAKTTVVDVARFLEVSHGTVYRHFASKAALRDCVAERWLHRISAPLEGVLAEDRPAPDKLRRWLSTLVAIKRATVRDDPEMFAAYSGLAEAARDVVAAHVADLVRQIRTILDKGVAEGAFSVPDIDRAARAVFDATVRFHHPLFAREWGADDGEARLSAVLDLVVPGLAAPDRR